MDEGTARRLNQINLQFYRTTATEFDQTRGQPWPGWDRVWDRLAAQNAGGEPVRLSVLDVGCGNGRLGLFLAGQMAAYSAAQGSAVSCTLVYHGLDTDVTLLARAEESLAAWDSPTVQLDVRLVQRDSVRQPPESGPDSDRYDLVGLFGVIHHIPGRQRRLDLMQALGNQLTPGGLLAFASWRFYEYARFRQRIVPWPDDLAGAVEAHDYLLDWRRGERALRYCHYVDDDEQAALIAASGLAPVETYRADGRSGDANCYSILQRADG